jgi:hypothetical protein
MTNKRTRRRRGKVTNVNVPSPAALGRVIAECIHEEHKTTKKG